MKTKTFGLISGTAKDFEADYLFATMQTMSKIEILHKFSDNEFDAIIIDEVYRAGSRSYKKIKILYDLIGNNAFSVHLRDIIHLGKLRYNDIYLNKPSISGFVLHEKYSLRNACHILNWGRDISSTRY